MNEVNVNEWNKLFNIAAGHFSLAIDLCNISSLLFQQQQLQPLPSRWWLLFCDFLFCFRQGQDAVLVKTLSMAYRYFGTNWKLFFVLVGTRGLMFQLRPWYHANISVFLLYGHNPVTMESIRGTSLQAQRFGNGTLATGLWQLSVAFPALMFWK